jgi:hypothetical protein
MTSITGRTVGSKNRTRTNDQEAAFQSMRGVISSNITKDIEIKIPPSAEPQASIIPPKPILISQRIVFGFVLCVFFCLLLLALYDPIDS